jgi:DNA-directed RNA polymerase subunit M/transcription elongation factor TFIIS
MRCATCGREHENVLGKCPFCTTPAAIVKRQRQRAADISGGYIFECKGCGQEVKEWKTVKIGGRSYELPVGHDKCFSK